MYNNFEPVKDLYLLYFVILFVDIKEGLLSMYIKSYIYEINLIHNEVKLTILKGWSIWEKEQITLIHDYHYTKVDEKDKKSYTEKMGKAFIIMGIGMILMECIIDFKSKIAYGVIYFGIFFVWGLIMMIMAQKKI